MWGWTAGGEELGNRIDDQAAGRLDGADWLAALGHSETAVVERGRNTVVIHDLPTIADLVAAPASRIHTPWADDNDQYRAGLQSFVEEMHGLATGTRGLPPWVGCGPRLLTRLRAARPS